jgi:S1-C subfamily serine protease
MPATAIDFDPHDDIAILHVPGLSAAVLTIAGNPPAGTAAAILGFPLDGPFDAEPGRVGRTEDISTDDAYGNGPVLRLITSLRGLVRPGNSGGPLIDSAGRVVAMVFASVTGAGRGTGGFAVPDSLVARQLMIARARGTDVSTGPCAG